MTDEVKQQALETYWETHGESPPNGAAGSVIAKARRQRDEDYAWGRRQGRWEGAAYTLLFIAIDRCFFHPVPPEVAWYSIPFIAVVAAFCTWDANRSRPSSKAAKKV